MTYRRVVDIINRRVQEGRADQQAQRTRFDYFRGILAELGNHVGYVEESSNVIKLYMNRPGGDPSLNTVTLRYLDGGLTLELFPKPRNEESGLFDLSEFSNADVEDLIAVQIADSLVALGQYEALPFGDEP